MVLVFILEIAEKAILGHVIFDWWVDQHGMGKKKKLKVNKNICGEYWRHSNWDGKRRE